MPLSGSMAARALQNSHDIHQNINYFTSFPAYFLVYVMIVVKTDTSFLVMNK